MKTCTQCQTVNADSSKFCQQCGRTLEAAPPSDATVQWKGGALPSARAPRRVIAVADMFGDKTRLVIGRAPDCDICLPHPMISRYHALLEHVPEGLRLRDLASVNGVAVDGQRITEPILLHEGVRVGIGPFLFNLRDGVIHSIDSSRNLRLEAKHLERSVMLPDGKMRKLLDDVNLIVNPGEFVSLLGPSGSGKSTLMDCLNGRRRATAGKVLANGEDFYRHYDSFRQSLGYVPQKDIVHTQLTVYRALYYTARLRLPTDTDPAELKGRIEEVIRLMELGAHRDTLVGDLSGGQIKRVSLGAELLAQPSLLFIDEATSGLDAGTEARMMRLFRRLAEEGRSIVCITHNVDNVDQCHLILVLARGRLVYYGPPGEAPSYFKVKRVSEIYDRIAERDVADWVRDYEASPLHQVYVKERQDSLGESQRGSLPAFSKTPPAPAPAEQASPPPTEQAANLPSELSASRQLVGLSKQPPLAERFRRITARYLRFREWLNPLAEMWHQFKVLTGRYVELIVGDRRGLRLLLLQAPIVGLFLLVGFLDKQFQSKMPIPRPLNDNERRMIAALQKLTEADTDGAFLSGGKMTEEQRKVLEKIEFEVQLPSELSGVQLVHLLQEMPEDSALEKLLENTSILVEGADGMMRPLKGKKILELVRKQNPDLPNDIAKSPLIVILRDPKTFAPGSPQMLLLEKTKLKFDNVGKPYQTNAADVLKLLNALGRDTKSGKSELESSLNSAKMRVPIDGKQEVFRAEDLRTLNKQLRDSKIPENLLKITGPVVPVAEDVNPRYTYMLLFILVMIVLWFGCNNAAKEIVKEEAIYARERAVNLGILPYLSSKFLILGIVTAFHSLVLMLVIFGPLELMHHLYPNEHSVPYDPLIPRMLSYPVLYGMLVLLSLTGVALGLLISACVATPDRANALLPYVLIPQIILGGGFLDVSKGLMNTLATTMSPVYWAFRAVHLYANNLPQEYPGHVPYVNDVVVPCEALIIQSVSLLVLTWWFLKRKDA